MSSILEHHRVTLGNSGHASLGRRGENIVAGGYDIKLYFGKTARARAAAPAVVFA